MSCLKQFVSFAALVFTSAGVGASVADAAQWTIVPQASSIRFSGSQMGQPLEGRFERFTGRIDFEPGVMPKGSVEIEIEVASISTGAGDRDEMALGGDWFNAKHMPKASFTAQTFTQTTPDNYEAAGDLTINGTTFPVALPFALKLDSNGLAEMTGQVSVDRLKFGLGTGQFRDPAMVSQNVRVDVLLHAQREP